MKTVAIIASGGYGKRLGLKVKKPFVLLGGKPLVSYALKAMERCKAVDAIIVAAERPCIGRLKAIAGRLKMRKLIGVVAGGKTRAESVCNCIAWLEEPFDIILIHDAARPLVDKALIESVIKTAASSGAAIAAVPESDTVKLVGGGRFIKATLPRSKIFRAQTPQAFRADIIKKAYSAGGAYFTDDAAAAEAFGCRVKIVEGSYRNLKITTKEDLKIAEALL